MMTFRATGLVPNDKNDIWGDAAALLGINIVRVLNVFENSRFYHILEMLYIGG